MPREFDPYHRWLGIPAEEQPADHYRLLGLVRFENDIEVIRDAAERQIGHVRRYGLGKHSELSQRILNELAGAKACLLDPDDKPAYDAQLRKKIQAATARPAAESAPQTPAARAAVTPPTPPLPVPPLPATVPAAARTEGLAGRSSAKGMAIGAAGAAGLLLVGWAVWVLALRGQDSDPTPPVVAARQDPASEPPAATPTMPQDKQSPSTSPRLAKILDQTATEGQALVVRAVVADRGSSGAGPLLFGLVQAPSGAKIDAESGVLTWTPTTDQARMKHAVTVQVVARDASELVDRVSFAVDVRAAVVLPPVLPTIPVQRLEAGARREVPVTAVDPNRPPRKLKFSLTGAPAWVRIDENSGTVTLEPPAGHEGRLFQAMIRVSGDAPNAPFAERSLAVAVIARPQTAGAAPAMPAAEDLSGLSEIQGPSGPLDPSQMNLGQTAAAAALDLMNRVGADPKVLPLFAGAFGGPVTAVVELNKANKLDGVVIDFQTGKDPVTCLNARLKSALDAMTRITPRRVFPSAPTGRTTLRRDENGPGASGAPSDGMGSTAPGAFQTAQAQQQAAQSDGMGSTAPGAFQTAQAQQQAAQAAWADVRLAAYLEFKQGYRHGKVATWDAGGQRVFWGVYQRGSPDAFCCLFENNRPRIVVVFDQGRKGPVYLVANNRVEKRFPSEEEAQRDATAQSLLTKLDDLESQFKKGERTLEGQIKKTIQAKIGNQNQFKRVLEQMRRSGRDARQKQGLQELQKAAGFR